MELLCGYCPELMRNIIRICTVLWLIFFAGMTLIFPEKKKSLIFGAFLMALTLIFSFVTRNTDENNISNSGSMKEFIIKTLIIIAAAFLAVLCLTVFGNLIQKKKKYHRLTESGITLEMIKILEDTEQNEKERMKRKAALLEQKKAIRRKNFKKFYKYALSIRNFLKCVPHPERFDFAFSKDATYESVLQQYKDFGIVIASEQDNPVKLYRVQELSGKPDDLFIFRLGKDCHQTKLCWLEDSSDFTRRKTDEYLSFDDDSVLNTLKANLAGYIQNRIREMRKKED